MRLRLVLITILVSHLAVFHGQAFAATQPPKPSVLSYSQSKPNGCRKILLSVLAVSALAGGVFFYKDPYELRGIAADEFIYLTQKNISGEKRLNASSLYSHTHFRIRLAWEDEFDLLIKLARSKDSANQAYALQILLHSGFMNNYDLPFRHLTSEEKDQLTQNFIEILDAQRLDASDQHDLIRTLVEWKRVDAIPVLLERSHLSKDPWISRTAQRALDDLNSPVK